MTRTIGRSAQQLLHFLAVTVLIRGLFLHLHLLGDQATCLGEPGGLQILRHVLRLLFNVMLQHRSHVERGMCQVWLQFWRSAK